jgi:hypothetical protein
VADQPGRKADLDKDGIVFADAGKAELDKDGIALESQEREAAAEGPKSSDAPAEAPVEGRPRYSRKFVMAAAGGAAGLVVLLAVIGFMLLKGGAEAPKTPGIAQQAPKAAMSGEGGLVLDPFMVFYETKTPRKSGILIAQVSLKVDPEVMPSIESRLYDIRHIIFRRLSAAASVYSQTEITLMLSDDLMDYPIQEVAFVQYNAR